jgi:uncharacterized protein (TIGR02145 family)
MYWNGSAWVRLPAGSNGQILQINGGMLGWANPDFICGVSKLWDIDGNTYNSVAIGSQCWIKENLKVSRYNDGTSIPLVTSGPWSVTTGAYAIYDNQPSNGTNATNYGFLYNWYAVTDTKRLCPTGWHIPTDTEWTTLTDYLGGLSVAGGKMKSTGTTYWNTDPGSTNESGFSALPGGVRLENGSFINIRSYAYFWSATEFDSDASWYRNLLESNGNAYGNIGYKLLGFSIRCLKD